jgi:hypothetical protein
MESAFLRLSKNCEKRAIQQENAFKLAENEAIGVSVRDSINDAQWLSSLPIWKQ